jgi:hypothetical protein
LSRFAHGPSRQSGILEFRRALGTPKGDAFRPVFVNYSETRAKTYGEGAPDRWLGIASGRTKKRQPRVRDLCLDHTSPRQPTALNRLLVFDGRIV